MLIGAFFTYSVIVLVAKVSVPFLVTRLVISMVPSLPSVSTLVLPDGRESSFFRITLKGIDCSRVWISELVLVILITVDSLT